MVAAKPLLSVERLASLASDPASLWISCHGYESRSVAHLSVEGNNASKKLSYGFDFPSSDSAPEVAKRIVDAMERLDDAGFSICATDDAGFEAMVQQEVLAVNTDSHCHIVSDISSMNRSRIASLLLACARTEFRAGCTLDVVYFPSSYVSHKHQYEPLEYFGPCHPRIAGWPDDPDLPSALLIGLGTEPRRADGVTEMLEPDILALYMPIGDEEEYVTEIQRENRRLFEVGGEPVLYSLRHPDVAYASLVATAVQLAERSRLVIVPLGPKIFCALSVAAALTIGPQVGVWKASAGRGVQPIDVASVGPPVLVRINFHGRDYVS